MSKAAQYAIDILRDGCKLQWLNIDKNTFPTSLYNIFLNDSNEHGCYFLKCYCLNLWIILVQSPTNLPKSMWKLVFNIIDVILKFGSPKRNTHKVQRNNAPFKTFKKYALGQRNWKTKKNCNSYGLMKILSNFNHSKIPTY